MRALPLLVLLGVAALLVPAAFANDEPDPDVARREIARSTVLIEWSRDAKTATLGLSADATTFLDLWFDFSRSKHARRTRPSTEFRGVPHAEWQEKEGGIGLRIAFASLEIESAALPMAEVPAALVALVSDDFTRAVAVEGDNPRWVRVWGVMLASELVARLPGDVTDEPFGEARQTLCEHLVRTFDATDPLPDGTIRVGSLESERLVWLLGVRATGCEAAGRSLCSLHARLKEDGQEQDAQAAAKVLADCPGREAEAFVLAELASGDWDRQLKVLSGAGAHASPVLLQVVEGLARDLEKDERAQMAYVVLQRAAQEGTAHRKDAARLLRGLLAEGEEVSERRTMAAMALAQSENADAGVIAYLEALIAHLEASEAHAGRIAFMRRVLERATKSLEKSEEPAATE